MLSQLALFFALAFHSGSGVVISLPDCVVALVASSSVGLAAPERPTHALAVADLRPAPTERPIPAQALPASPVEGGVVNHFGLPSVLGQIGTARLDAGAIVGKVQEFYKGTNHLRAKFRQTTVTKAFGRKQVSDGRVYILKPGKMRWDYMKVKKGQSVVTTRSFISDGARLWAVNHDDKQYVEKDLDKDLLPVAVTFLTGRGDLARDFTSALDTSGKYGTKSDYVLELTPRMPSAQYKHLWMVVDATNYRVKESIVLNAAGDTNSIRFYEPDTAKVVAASWFSFNPKQHKDYRLFDPDKMGPAKR